MKSEQKRIGRFIADLRKRRGMTQVELAQALHTSQSAVARMERGDQNMSVDLLSKVSQVLARDVLRMPKEGVVNFQVTGGKKLSGTIKVNVSKNAAMGLLAASLLNKGKTTLKNMPRIEEVFRIIEVLESIGVKVEWDGNDVVIKPSKKLRLDKIDVEAGKKTRTIIMFLGPLMHLVDRFRLPYAGGCKLGTRTVRPHLFALEEMGLEVETKEDYYDVSVKKPTPASVVLYEAGDTVTENVLMAAAKMDGVTTIKYASANYMVQEVCFFLERLGVQIDGIGTTTLVVHGVSEICQDVVYEPSEDPIEAMSFLTAAIVTKSAITIQRCAIDFLELELLKLEKMGFRYKILREYKADNGRTRLVDIKTFPSHLTALKEKIAPQPYPGINIDNLPFFVAIASVAEGRTLVHDWVYENRAIYYTELNKIGGKVTLADVHRVYVDGPVQFHSAEVMCPDALRPALIILIGMLAAPGVSVLRNVYTINRGYESIAERLNMLGAKVEVMTEL